MNKFLKKLRSGFAFSLIAISSLSAGWTPPETISDSTKGANFQYDPSNRLLVTWTNHPTSSEVINAAFLSPLGVLSTPQILGSPGFRSISSVNPATGDAVVAWIGDNATQTIETAIYTKNTDTWTPLLTLYTPPSGYSIDNLVGVSYGIDGKAVILWETDDGMGNFFYNASTLSGGAWGTIGTLPVTNIGTPLNDNGAVSTNAAFAAVAFTYQNAGNFYQVSRFSGSTWTTQHTEQFPIAVITPGGINVVIDNSGNIALGISFDDGTNDFIYGWGTGETSGEVLTSSPAIINKGGITLCVDNNGRAYLVWQDTSFFMHGKNFLFSQPLSWSQDSTIASAIPALIDYPFAPDANGHLSVELAAQPAPNTLVQEVTYTASSSSSSAGSWSSPIQISNGEINTQAIASNPLGAVLLSWHALSGEGFVQEVHKPNIAASFTPILSIAPGDISIPYISNAGNKALIFAPLTDSPFDFSLTVFIDDTPIVIPPNPPTNFIGESGKNKFLTQTERFNALTWTASTTSTVVNYLIFRNGLLAAVIPATGPLLYVDYNRNKHVSDTYTLYAVDVSGAQSTPVTLVLP